MILLIGGQKGGTGKTSISTGIAAALSQAGKSVIVIDTDEQKSALKWVTCREKTKQPLVLGVGRSGDIAELAMQFSGKFDEVIIDVAGVDSASLRSGLVVADWLYTPVAPSLLDTDTLYTVDSLVGQAAILNKRLRGRIVFNRTDARPKDVEETRADLSDLKHLMFSEAILRQRKIWMRAYKAGKGVMECSDAKAKLELAALMTELYDLDSNSLAAPRRSRTTKTQKQVAVQARA